MAVDYRSRQLRKYQNNFTTRFAQMMSKQLPVWKEVQKQKRKSLYSWQSILVYVVISLLAYIPGKREYNYDLKLHFFLSIVFFVGAVIQNIISTNKEYQNAIKGMLFPTLIKVFGQNIYYACTNVGNMAGMLSDSFLSSRDTARILTDFAAEEEGLLSGYMIENRVFEESQFFKKAITQRENDDRFYGKYNDVEFVINETEFGWNENDKHRTYHKMFGGVAMKFKLNKEIKQRVLIVSKNTFFRPSRDFEKVDVEYNKFAKKYNVYVFKYGVSGSAQIEARYLLNTAFLDRFMQLHTSFAVPKLQCSVYGNQMLIMLSTRKDLFELNHLFGRIDDIKQYKHLFEEFASVLSFIDVLNLSSKTKL